MRPRDECHHSLYLELCHHLPIPETISDVHERVQEHRSRDIERPSRDSERCSGNVYQHPRIYCNRHAMASKKNNNNVAMAEANRACEYLKDVLTKSTELNGKKHKQLRIAGKGEPIIKPLTAGHNHLQ